MVLEQKLSQKICFGYAMGSGWNQKYLFLVSYGKCLVLAVNNTLFYNFEILTYREQGIGKEATVGSIPGYCRHLSWLPIDLKPKYMTQFDKSI